MTGGMMFKGTPGPWFSHGRYIGTKNHKSAVGECRDVNGNWSDDAKSSADATLIAAAPDLLDALRVFAACADEIDYVDKERDEPTPDEEWAKLRLTVGDYRKARAAIAKALGEQK